MPYKRPFGALEAKYVTGGSLCDDLSFDSIAPHDFRVASGWRRRLDSMVVREGWGLWQPNPGFAAALQSFTGLGQEVLLLAEVNSPAGKTVVVAVVGSTIRYFDYDTGLWVQIGSGFQTAGIRRWDMEQLNGYAVFNNGVDLPVSWRVGDASVTPLYELRERGVASVGVMTEYSGFIMFGDITEVNSDYMSTLMNSGDPYGLVPSPATNTSRTQYRIIWSNVSDPTDWAATVNVSGTSGSTSVTLDWPMASFQPGDEVTIVGGGTLGSNLVTNIVSIAGTTAVLLSPLGATVSNTPMSDTDAIGSVVGYYDIQDDGSAIMAMMPLQNRLVVYRPFSLFVGVYTGNIEFPFQFDRTYQGERGLKFPHTLVNVRGQFHLYAGATAFYKYELGSLEPSIDEALFKCAFTEFFSKDYDVTDLKSVYAVDNGVTSEIFFVLPFGVGQYTTLCYSYLYNTVSTINNDWQFRSAATVRKPLAGQLGDPSESWFIMGTANGMINVYGRTSRELTIMQRNSANWSADLHTGLLWMNDSFNEKDIRTFVPLYNSVSGAFPLTVTSFYQKDVAAVDTQGTTQIVPTPGGDTIVPMWQRGIYHRFEMRVDIDSAAVEQPSLTGYLAEYDVVGTRSVTRMV